MRGFAALALALCVLSGVGCASSGPLATVDGYPITSDHLESAFSSRHSGHLAFLVGESEVRSALAREIENRLLIQEAERLELGEREDIAGVVDARVERRAVQHLRQVEIDDPAQPSDEEVRAAWEEHTGELIEVRQIVVPTRAEMDEIQRLLVEGAPMEELAKERSRVVSRRAAGLLPPIGWGTMEAAWDEVVFELEPGEISKPFQSGGAWEMVEMVERKAVERPDYDRAYNRVKGVLLRRHLETRRADLASRLFAQYEVEIALEPLDPQRYLRALEESPETVVASWQGGRITVGELTGADLETLVAMNPERSAYLLESGIRDAVTERLMPLEAHRRGYTELPEIVAEGEKLRDDLMLAVLLSEFVYRDVEATDEEVRFWYDAHPEEVMTPERRRVAQLLVATEDDAIRARRRIMDGEPFGGLVDELSLDRETAARGGDLGWVTAEQTPSGWEGVLELAEGEISEPLESDLGWHLVRVLEIEPPRALAYEDVQDSVRTKVLEEKRAQRKAEWLTQIRAATEVEVHDRAIRAYVENPSREGGG